jgi:hypothetical protein
MPLSPANEQQMRGQGFPDALQTAFKRTAEEVRSVILSRVPGPATTELIAAGYDLKGFFIKAKSCDWGPMTGFLCQVPAFNKKGVGGIEHNARENLKYHNKFCDRLRPPQEGADDRVSVVHRIKSIFENHKLMWQEAWQTLLPETDEVPTRTVARLRDYLKDENIVATLSKVALSVPVLTDDQDSARQDERFLPRLSDVVHDLRVLVEDRSPFVPLKLTQKVFDRFKEKEEDNNSELIRTIGDITCGVAFNGEPKNFVCFAYVIKKEKQNHQDGGESLYELYHGDIRVSVGGNEQDLEPFLEALRDKQDAPIVDAKDKDILLPPKPGIKLNAICSGDAPGVAAALKKTWVSFKSKRNLTTFQPDFKDDYVVYPIQGIQNYYPPFSGDDAHLNAVTGDYDLFACWPKIHSGGLEDLIRGSERLATRDTLFSRMSSKPYSLRASTTPNVFVEVIPTFKELADKRSKGLSADHSSFGYVNDLVLLVAGTLNSFVNSVNLGAEDPRPSTLNGRNVAFHGDEGGRPNIVEVDYEVAAFVPKILMAAGTVAKDLMGEEAGNENEQNEQMFLITNHVELLTLINAVKPHCYVPLNFAWLYAFLVDERSDAEVVKGLLKEVFWKDAADSTHAKLKDAFTKLFGKEQPATSEQKVDLLVALKADPEPAS